LLAIEISCGKMAYAGTRGVKSKCDVP